MRPEFVRDHHTLGTLPRDRGYASLSKPVSDGDDGPVVVNVSSSGCPLSQRIMEKVVGM
jgi:hypothetical protein